MFDQVGEGVYRRRYESLDLNVGVVLGEDGVLIVDTRSTHREAAELIDDLGRLTRLPVRWVVNTHWHWDHVFGNALFTDADIWGHELCIPAMETLGDRMKRDARHWMPPETHDDVDAVEVVVPNRTFSESATVSIGREVDLTYHGLAHTNADIIIRIPDADVAFFGDMIEEGAPPNFGDSHPEIWPETLRNAASAFPTTGVPGHGDIVDEMFVLAQIEELEAVAALAADYAGGDDAALIRPGPYPADVMASALKRARYLRRSPRNDL